MQLLIYEYKYKYRGLVHGVIDHSSALSRTYQPAFAVPCPLLESLKESISSICLPWDLAYFVSTVCVQWHNAHGASAYPLKLYVPSYLIANDYFVLVTRTLTGHKSSIKCTDFHPYGEYITSGSMDTNVKVSHMLTNEFNSLSVYNYFLFMIVHKKSFANIILLSRFGT